MENDTQEEKGNYPNGILYSSNFEWIYQVLRSKDLMVINPSDKAWLWGLARIVWTDPKTREE